ncbi:hypothetical protein BGX38DRAFT_1272652 [Terfezia claveryi]|nr:hypothetical protein BGX38DRAFT_1272652 [Terfezia claveryi]
MTLDEWKGVGGFLLEEVAPMARTHGTIRRMGAFRGNSRGEEHMGMALRLGSQCRPPTDTGVRRTCCVRSGVGGKYLEENIRLGDELGQAQKELKAANSVESTSGEVEDASAQSITIETKEVEVTEVKELAMERKKRRKVGSKEKGSEGKGKGKERAKDSLPAGDTPPTKNRNVKHMSWSMVV